MRKCITSACLLLMVMLFLASASVAADEKALTVSSERQSIDYAARILTYEGEVDAYWQDYSMQADYVTVYITEQDTLDRLEASGNVMFNKGQDLSACCDTVSYDLAQDLIVMEGNVSYEDEMGNMLQAQKVSLWPEIQKLLAEGQPVRATYALGEELDGASSEKSE